MKRLRMIFPLALTSIIIAATVSPALAAQSASVPAIMYHYVAESGSGDYCITPDALENDLRYLNENNYTAISTSDLTNFVYNGVPLPENPILLTFDDGYYNNYAVVWPLLEKYDMKAVLSVIGSYTDTWSKPDAGLSLRYGHCTWGQLAELAASDNWEIASHTYNLHEFDKGRQGCRINVGEDVGEYKQLLKSDLLALQNALYAQTGSAPSCFTYPFGFTCPYAEDVLEDMGFMVVLKCSTGVLNTITQGDGNCLYNVYRTNRPPGRPVSQILADMK